MKNHHTEASNKWTHALLFLVGVPGHFVSLIREQVHWKEFPVHNNTVKKNPVGILIIGSTGTSSRTGISCLHHYGWELVVCQRY
mmetsp:Transcript_14101/g.15319  ORF Transcript_14101/g.15319 Transcript_14101/m.15319 type:complete len:84 (-) Transcript_14101:171-422(-)